MGKRCVLFGCGNTSKDGVSLHLFPRDGLTNKQWNRFVLNSRSDWTRNSQHSTVCSAHFTQESFEVNEVASQLGFSPRCKTLKAGAVPTIKVRDAEASVKRKTPAPRKAVEKRRHLEIMEDIFPSYTSSATTTSTSPEEHNENVQTEEEPLRPTGTCRPRGVQCSIQTANKKLQVKPRTKDKGIQAIKTTATVGCQTDLSMLMVVDTSVPTLQQSQEGSSVDDAVDDCESDDDKDGDNDCYPDDDSDYYPEDDEESDETFDMEDCSSSTSIPVPPADKERKFVVFESCLLKLFAICMVCGQATARGVISNTVGTMVAVTQVCELCTASSTWVSQPLIGETPAGNLLLSMAILFTGSLPTKTLRLFRVLGVQVYERSTFFRHQTKHLHQAVRTVWEKQQREILATASSEGMVIGGDARCDSMGHSAKYGSYTAIDLDRNKIIDVQIVQHG